MNDDITEKLSSVLQNLEQNGSGHGVLDSFQTHVARQFCEEAGKLKRSQDRFTWPCGVNCAVAQVNYIDAVGLLTPSTSPKVVQNFFTTVESLNANNDQYLLHNLQTLGLSGDMCKPRIKMIELNLVYMTMLSVEVFAGLPLAELSQVDYEKRVHRQIQLHQENEQLFSQIEKMIQQRKSSKPMVLDETAPPAETHMSPLLIDELQPHQKLLEYLLSVAQSQNLRRTTSSVYMPVVLEDSTPTRFYKYHCDLEEWMFSTISPIAGRSEHYQAITSKPGTPSHLVNLLSKVVDQRFPFLNKKRTLFSYRNGVFDAASCCLYWFDPSRCTNAASKSIDELDSRFTTSNYFDFDVDEAMLTCDPMEIETPSFDRIFVAQQFTPMDMSWFYGLSGRMVHDVGDKDDWQVALYVAGVASSGKSTFFRIFSQVIKTLVSAANTHTH